jgi:hypothetical protein
MNVWVGWDVRILEFTIQHDNCKLNEACSKIFAEVDCHSSYRPFLNVHHNCLIFLLLHSVPDTSAVLSSDILLAFDKHSNPSSPYNVVFQSFILAYILDNWADAHTRFQAGYFFCLSIDNFYLTVNRK